MAEHVDNSAIRSACVLSSMQVLLFNDPFNKRARVQSQLQAAGLAEKEAQACAACAWRILNSIWRTFGAV